MKLQTVRIKFSISGLPSGCKRSAELFNITMKNAIRLLKKKKTNTWTDKKHFFVLDLYLFHQHQTLAFAWLSVFVPVYLPPNLSSRIQFRLLPTATVRKWPKGSFCIIPDLLRSTKKKKKSLLKISEISSTMIRNQITLIPLVSSSSNEPMSKASAALTSPRGGISGGVYFCRYTCCQSMPLKNGCSLTSSALEKDKTII